MKGPLVEGEGFEPSKAEPSDLQSDPFDRSGTPPNRTRDYAACRVGCQTDLAFKTVSQGKNAPDLNKADILMGFDMNNVRISKNAQKAGSPLNQAFFGK